MGGIMWPVISTLAERTYLAAGVAGAAALLFGGLAGVQPKLALGLAAAVCVGLLAFRAPVANLVLLVFLTAVVPYGILNQFGVGGGTQSPGLLPSDLLLLAGLTWAVLVVSGHTLDGRRLLYATFIVAFLAVAALQFLHGLKAGHDRSQVGAELRVLLGFGTFLIALPLLADLRARRRLLVALTAAAIALGAWGMLQWVGHFSYSGADVGVRSGVRLTSGGTGQLQGGEYGFPVAIIVCFAVLISGAVRSVVGRGALMLAVVLNSASCLVTFERTFWLDTVLGVSLVLMRAGAVRRMKALVFAPLVVLLSAGVLSATAPTILTTARERLTSLGQYSTDDSVRYRTSESHYVLNEIRAHPLVGSGLAASIFWGQPWAQVPAMSSTFAHNGYLWLAWKAGIPAALVLVFLFGAAILARAPPGDDELGRAIRHGAQGALAGLMLASVTFPSFSSLGITSVMGVLLALSVAPLPAQREA
jgi:hypothetical protein